MRRGNPRRDAIEYGLLLTLTTTMTAGLGLLLYVAKTLPEEGQQHPRLNLDAPMDFKGAFRTLQQFARGDLSALNENSRAESVGRQNK